MRVRIIAGSTPEPGGRLSDTTIGIDIGTTSVKGVRVDAQGRVLARTRVPHYVTTTGPGTFEHDANAAWRHGVTTAFGELAGGNEVRAVSVAAMVPSLAAFDPETGEATSAGLLYGDVRGRAGRTGMGDEGEACGFLEWLVERHPGRNYWPAQAAASHALCGRAVIDTVTAASTTPLWFGAGWNPDVLDRLAIPADRLPEAVDPARLVGTVTGTAVAVAASTIDGVAEQIVAGADQPGDVLVVLGTTLLVWVAGTEWIEVPGCWTIPSMASPAVLIGGPSTAGGLAQGWLDHIVAECAQSGVHVASAKRVPLFVPYVRGERVPLHDPDRRAMLAELDVDHGPGALRRAGFEACGFVVRRIIETVAAAGGPVGRRIVATGGGANVPEWLAAIADATDLEVYPTLVAEGAAFGAAWCARMAVDDVGFDGAAQWAGHRPPIEPHPAWVGPVADRYTRWLTWAT